MHSQRNLFPQDVWRYPLYEFEDIIREVDDVDLLAPRPGERFKLGFKIAKRIGLHSPLAMNPGVPRTRVQETYDLLLVSCSLPWDLLTFRLEGWRDRCRRSVCLLDEIWVKQIPQQKTFLKSLSQFDLIVLQLTRSVSAVGDLTGKPCTFLPPGVDTLRFCPIPRSRRRVVDVYSIGRRSPVTHRKLLELSETRGIFYVYDSLWGKRAFNLEEHRALYANTAGRSRFFLVNPGMVDDLGKRGDQSDIGNRYFEGAAAGCILVGEAPAIKEFQGLFDWPDAVIPLPFGSDGIGEIIDAFDRQPAREAALHQTNIVQSLRRHDWAYRWEALLRTAGLPARPGLARRKERLEELAVAVEPGTDPGRRAA